MFPPETTLHPRKWPAGLPLIAALVIFVFLSPQKNDYTIPVVCGLLVLGSIFVYILLSYSRVEISETGVAYINLFRKKEFSWSDITKTYLKFRHYGKSGRYYWYFEDPDGKKLRFPISLYSRKNLQILAQVVAQQRKLAISDDRILSMSEGRFPWYIF